MKTVNNIPNLLMVNNYHIQSLYSQLIEQRYNKGSVIKINCFGRIL